MFRAGPVDLKPGVYTAFVVDAEAGQSGDGVSLLQILQTDHTLACISRQHIIVVGEAGLAQTHDEVNFHFIGRYRLGADRTLEPAVSAEPPGRYVQGQGVCERPPRSQIQHTVRMMPPARFLVAVSMSCIRPRISPCSVRVPSASGGVKSEWYRGTVIYTHPCH